MTTRQSLVQLAVLFLRLGATAFGGPAAHIAMMRSEIVDRRGWLTDTEFLDLIAATHLIPGPNSTEMAIHIGFRRGRLLGLAIAGLGFILPSSLIVGTIAWGYMKFGDTPQVSWLMYGIGPVVVAIILQAVWKLGRAAITTTGRLGLAITVATLSLVGVNELVLLAGGALVFAVSRRIWSTALSSLLATIAGGSVVVAAMTPLALTVPVTLTKLTLFFVKVGSVLFGSGYVLLAFLRADLVERWGWLTEQQLIDAITVGQVTPGPVLTTATFIGYLLHGWLGAALSTIAIFLPGFIFVTITQSLVPRLRKSLIASALLDGVVVASLGLMGAVTWHLVPATVIDVPSAIIAVGSAVALAMWSPNSTWLILAGATVGWILQSGELV